MKATSEINTYFAVLLITLMGAGASLVIIRVATDNSFDVMYSNAGSLLP